jgi:hypothetical protein
MNNTITHTNNFEITGFSASHIIFDKSNYVTLWAKCKLHSQLTNVHLIFTYNQLNDLMRFNGEQGEQILLAMIDEMMTAKQPPYMLDLKKTLGKEPVFTTCKLTLSPMLLQASKGNEACYLVADIWPINIIQQAKNLIQHAHDFDVPPAINRSLINTSLNQLKEMYNYYLGLLELDIRDEAAREKANLHDVHLFEMAKSAARISA